MVNQMYNSPKKTFLASFIPPHVVPNKFYLFFLLWNIKVG